MAQVSLHVHKLGEIRITTGPLAHPQGGSFHSIELDGAHVFFEDPEVGRAIAKAFEEAAGELEQFEKDREAKELAKAVVAGPCENEPCVLRVGHIGPCQLAPEEDVTF